MWKLVYNIFRNTFTTKFMWKVVTSFNLNLLLKLSFYSPILTDNNLLLKIYCYNIVKILWLHFSIKIFYFLYYFSFLSFHFIHTFFLSFFLLHTRLSLSHLSLLFFLFLLPSQKCSQSHSIFFFFFVSSSHSRSLFFFFFFFPSSIHICPYLFPSFLSFSPSFKNVLASAFILSLFSFFFLQLSLSGFFFFFFFFYLIPKQPLCLWRG